jgi:hypothetical protein
VMRPRRPISHALGTHRRIPIGPPLRGRPRHVELVRGKNDGPSVVDDQARDAQPVTRRQRRISVGHEDLLVDEVFALTAPLHDRRSFFTPNYYSESSHPLNQRPWAVHLEVSVPQRDRGREQTQPDPAHQNNG